MSDPIEFYFDFSSPYGYLASERIDAIAARHGREAAWRPYLMGVAMKVTGSAPVVNRPMLGAYSRRDMERSARRLRVPFRFPEPFSDRHHRGLPRRVLDGAGRRQRGEAAGAGAVPRVLRRRPQHLRARRGRGRGSRLRGRPGRAPGRHSGARDQGPPEGSHERRGRSAGSSARRSSWSMESRSGATTGWTRSTAGSNPAAGSPNPAAW